jgi:hypothetical protein
MPTCAHAAAGTQSDREEPYTRCMRGCGARTRTYFARQLVAISLCYVLIWCYGGQGAQDVALQVQRYSTARMA